MKALYKNMLISLFINLLSAQSATGSISGSIKDAYSKYPLIGANISIRNTNLGAASDLDGHFSIENLAVGHYTLEISYLGYKNKILSDVLVKSNRETELLLLLFEDANVSDEVLVEADYFSDPSDIPVGTISFSNEEIRRAPGTAGDVSRIVMSLPSIAKVNDQSNSLIVRGGHPSENGFYIDNIEIENINHFPTQGSSGGPISLINVDLVNDLTFNPSGFSSEYGEKLSSIMEISFRDGNRENYNFQFDFNFTGFGAVIEGPLSKKASFLFSARRSYIDLISSIVDVGTTAPIVYGDIIAKLSYQLNTKHKLSFLSLYGDDHNSPNEETALKEKMITYGEQNYQEMTHGVNWEAVWNKNAYSKTSLSFSRNQFDEHFFESVSRNELLKNQSTEHKIKLRNINNLNMKSLGQISFGIEYKTKTLNMKNRINNHVNLSGDTIAEYKFNGERSNYALAFFASLKSSLSKRLSSSIAFRSSYFSELDKFLVSPRISLTYKISPKLNVQLSSGMYFQTLPNRLLLQSNTNFKAKELYNLQYNLAFKYALAEDTRLSIDLYKKDYYNFPIDPAQESLFIIDEIVYSNGFYQRHEALLQEGKAFSHGLEISLQKKLKSNLYGLISATWFRSRYKTSDGKLRNRVYDNQFVFNLEGGYKMSKKWEFSGRWLLAGASPYTPFDNEKSTAAGRAILDLSQTNEKRYPIYHSLNLRADRRFNWEKSNMIIYLSLWNAYNQKNIATHFWNPNTNSEDKIYQWNLLPILGVEYEF